MKRFLVVLTMLTLTIPVAGATFAAESYYEGWNVPDDPAGWLPNTAHATVAVVNAGGNPGGYLQSTRDPGGTFPIGARTELPAATGDWAAAGVFEVSFDVLFETGAFTSADFRIRYSNATFNGWHVPFTGDFTPGVWRTYVIPVDPFWTDAEAMAAGWVQESGSPTFAETLADVYYSEVRIDGTGEPLAACIDNFRIRTCTQRTLTLFANFDGDTPGLPPDLTLPGPPPCDALAIFESSGTVRVAAGVGTLTNQPVLLDQVPGTGAVDLLAYTCDLETCGLATVRWNSLSRSYGNFFLACVLRDAGGLILGSVEYRPDGVLTYNSVGGVGPALPVAYVPDVDQEFEILVDMATRTTSLSVDGIALPGFQNVPFAQAAAGPVDRLGFEGGGTTAQQFAVDNILAFACDCPCVVDTTPPEITVELTPNVLWPPNHKMVEVCATVTVVDDCDPAPTVVLVAAWSDEPDNGLGDGNTVDDIQGADIGTADDCLLLRAERQGGEDGRTYTVRYCATDASGNTACATAEVNVPHDQSGGASPVAGFLPDGTAILPAAEGIVLAVRSTRSLDAPRIDVTRAWVGNHLGYVAPSDAATADIDADGALDLLLTYPAARVRELAGATAADVAEAPAVVTEEVALDGAWAKESALAVAFRYELAGEGYLVPDVFGLGRVIAIEDGGPAPRRPDRPIETGDLALRPGGRIELSLPAAGRVSVQVFDIRGRRVRTIADGDLPAGLHAFVWDGTDDGGQRLGSGIYFLKGEGPGLHSVQKVSLIR